MKNTFASQDDLFQDQALPGYASHIADVSPVAFVLLEDVIPLWSLSACWLSGKWERFIQP